MERKIILDFIGQNFSNLSSIGLKQLTVFVYGKNYSDEILGSKLLNGDQLFAYDVKLPRIFCKKFPLEKMMSGMLELASDLNKLTIFKKSDFNFSLEEVYSGKNIQDLNFDYLYLYPVIKDDLRIGAILIYGTILNENFDLLSNSISLLYNGLVNFELEHFKQSITNSLFDNESIYYLLGKENNEYFYLSENLSERLQIKNPCTATCDAVKPFINHHLVKKVNLRFPFEDCFAYVANKNDFDDKTANYLHVSSLNSIDLSDEFTVVVIDYSQHTSSFVEFIQTLNLVDRYYLCACEDGFYMLVIDKKYKKTEIRKMLKGINSFYITLLAPNDVNNHMDFTKIVKYLKEVRPNEFLYHEYLTFINAVCSDALILNKNKYQKQYIVSSTDANNQTILLNYVTTGFKYIENSLEYEKLAVNKLNKHIKDTPSSCFIGLESISLLKRKTIEIYKKFQNKNIPLSIIVHYHKDTTKEELYNSLSLLKLYDIKIIADSSIFLNLDIIDTMNLFDGCYVHKEEFKSLMEMNNRFINMFITYFYNDSKIIIFEQTNNLEYNNRFENESIYFVKESEGK